MVKKGLRCTRARPLNRAAQDTTLINLRPLKRQLAELAQRVKALEDRVTNLEHPQPHDYSRLTCPHCGAVGCRIHPQAVGPEA